MQSISRIEFELIEFLVRNFDKRYTVREVSKKLKASAAAVHKLTKRLEQDRILSSEKLGTGLFYKINLYNLTAKHLAAIVLLQTKPANLELEARAIMIKGKNLLIIAHEHPKVPSDYTSQFYTEHEFVLALKERDEKALSWIKDGEIIQGENYIIHAIMEAMPKY